MIVNNIFVNKAMIGTSLIRAIARRCAVFLCSWACLFHIYHATQGPRALPTVLWHAESFRMFLWLKLGYWVTELGMCIWGAFLIGSCTHLFDCWARGNLVQVYVGNCTRNRTRRKMAGYHTVATFPHPSLLDHFLLSCELKVSRWCGGWWWRWRNVRLWRDKELRRPCTEIDAPLAPSSNPR